ncbi:MAG: hypothetical protein WB581_11270, partial [Halobacteriota archaeon]
MIDMHLNYKMVSLAIAALVVFSVFSGVAAIATTAAAKKGTEVAVTVSSDPAGVVSGQVANHAKLKLPAATVNSVTFTATESGVWSVTRPSGASSMSPSQPAMTIYTQVSGVYTVSLTPSGSTKPIWSATI